MTPDLPDHPTDLTPEQRKYLENIRRFVAEPPTAAALYGKNLPKMAVLAVLFGGIAAWGWAAEQYWAMWFNLGLLAGLLLAICTNITRAARLWPATAAIIDRDQLDRLAGEADPNRR